MANPTYENTTGPFEKKYMPLYDEVLRQLYGPNCIIKYEPILDLQHATDRVVITPFGEKIRYACRGRNEWYRQKYYDEFTIRNSEMPKILNNEANYFLYGFLNEKVDKIIQLIRIDLFYFAWYYKDYFAINKFNINTTNGFTAHKIKDFKKYIERII